MQGPNLPSKQDSYDRLVTHLLNTEHPLNYSLEYLLENYGDKAVPALMQALPVRPWYEQQIILDTLGKIGDVRAILPVCALVYEEKIVTKLPDSSLTSALRNLVYYTNEHKKAISILLDTMCKYQKCCSVLTVVLKEQNDKHTIKMVYRKLFKQKHSYLKESAISIIGEDNAITEYRIKYLKKMHFRLKDSFLRGQTIKALKILIARKRCKRLCKSRGLRFDAFFRRPENESYDCCCIDKSNRRVLIKFEGSIMSEASERD